MKALLAAGIVAGAILTIAGMAQSADPPGFTASDGDFDRDGAITILDITILAQHFTESVTPQACYTSGQYATPVTLDGYTFDRYLLVPPGDPAASGALRRLVPCP